MFDKFSKNYGFQKDDFDFVLDDNDLYNMLNYNGMEIPIDERLRKDFNNQTFSKNNNIWKLELPQNIENSKMLIKPKRKNQNNKYNLLAKEDLLLPLSINKINQKKIKTNKKITVFKNKVLPKNNSLNKNNFSNILQDKDIELNFLNKTKKIGKKKPKKPRKQNQFKKFSLTSKNKCNQQNQNNKSKHFTFNFFE